LDHFYGEGYFITSTQTVIIENFGQQVSIDDVRYDVENVEFFNNAVVLKYYDCRTTDSEKGVPASKEFSPMSNMISVPTNAYEQAQATGGPVTVSSTTTTETKPVNAWPIAAGIGISMGVMVFAVWVGYQEMRGSATSTLLEHGLHDMTVRDVEIVGHIMKLGKFTIPELMKLIKASKITIWRTVKKLVEQGLVQSTEETKLAANGLGGRGKPSRIYRYVGKTKI
ncbi:MAG: MarR family transcriptional regulator, partial [Candidatus Hadarchaeaceae archaeon]